MASNPYVNKVQKADGSVIMDISSDTVTPNEVLNGVTFHDRSGAAQQGSVITHNVYDGLNSTSTDDALSANQGKVLNDMINAITSMDLGNISNTSKNITCSASTYMLLISVGASDGRMGMWLIRGSSNGFQLAPVLAASNVTISVNNATLIITTNVNNVYFSAYILRGSKDDITISDNSI